MRRFLCAMLAAGALAATEAARAEDMRVEAVHFPPGSSGTAIGDSITGYESVSYTFGAEAGQRMSVTLEPSNSMTYFNLYAPGFGPGDAALANSGFPGADVPDLNRYEGTLPASGEYTISVYLMRSAARRNEASDYTLEISVTEATGDLVESGFADGLAGGPDVYRVATSGGALNLRAAPSGAAAVVTRLADGTALRNLGCRMAEGRRWCHVALPSAPGTEGWAAGEFLSEGAAMPKPRGRAAAAARSEGLGAAGIPTGERVSLSTGAAGATRSGMLAPAASRRYVIAAREGQFLNVEVKSDGPGLRYQIFNPDSSFLLEQTPAAQAFGGELWRSGDYAVEIFNLGAGPVAYEAAFGIE